MKFSSVIALAAGANAMPRHNIKESSLNVITRSNDTEPTNVYKQDNGTAIAHTRRNATVIANEGSNATVHKRGENNQDKVKENMDKTYQECLLAVLDQIKNGKVSESPKGTETPRELKEPKEACGCAEKEEKPEAPKHCGCSKSYDNPNPSDCNCPKPCPCQPMEERPEYQQKLKEQKKPEEQREEDPGDESDDEDLDSDDGEDDSDDEDEPKEHCEPKETEPCDHEPVEECRPEPCESKPEPCEPEPKPKLKPCEPKPEPCEPEPKPKPCEPKPYEPKPEPPVPACQNYAKQGDCLFCDQNKNKHQDANKACIPKARPQKPCDENTRDSDDECGYYKGTRPGKNNKEAPYNPLRKAPFDHTFAPKDWHSFKTPEDFELPKDLHAPQEFFAPGAPCYGLQDQRVGDFLLKDLLEPQL